MKEREFWKRTGGKAVIITGKVLVSIGLVIGLIFLSAFISNLIVSCGVDSSGVGSLR